MLLGSKFLWRQGYVRCPESCSADTPQSECVCSCPSEIIDGRTSEQVLEDAGVSTIYSLMDQQFIEGVGLTYDEMLALLCHVGHAGDMFTSAAPQDPLFWRVTPVCCLLGAARVCLSGGRRFAVTLGSRWRK